MLATSYYLQESTLRACAVLVWPLLDPLTRPPRPAPRYTGLRASAGGIAYLGVWGRTNHFFMPAFVFPNQLSRNSKYVAAEWAAVGFTLQCMVMVVTTVLGHWCAEVPWC